MTPDSPRVPEMLEKIDRVQATVLRTGEEVAETLGRGEFEQARTLAKKLATVIPAASRRISETEDMVEQARATATAAEKNVLDAIAKALAAVNRADHDARIRFTEAARKHLTQLAGVSPRFAARAGARNAARSGGADSRDGPHSRRQGEAQGRRRSQDDFRQGILHRQVRGDVRRIRIAS